MAGTFLSQSQKMKSTHQSIDRKGLILALRKVIRQDHKLVRQINRKYQSHQMLEQYRDNLKQRIRQLTTAML